MGETTFNGADVGDILKHIRVRQATTEGERRAIYRFRYSVYVKELGRFDDEADHERCELRDLADTRPGTFNLYTQDTSGEVTGALRIVCGMSALAEPFNRRVYGLEQVAVSDGESIAVAARLMVSPALRGSRHAISLMCAAYDEIRARGGIFTFCHCEARLVPLYERMGFLRWMPPFVEPDLGERIPLILIMDDVEHLTKVRSPFALQATRFPCAPAVPERRWTMRNWSHPLMVQQAAQG